MAVSIKSLGVEVPGKVVRTFDAATNTTTLQLDEDQSTSLHEQLGPVMEFFYGQDNGDTRPAQ